MEPGLDLYVLADDCKYIINNYCGRIISSFSESVFVTGEAYCMFTYP